MLMSCGDGSDVDHHGESLPGQVNHFSLNLFERAVDNLQGHLFLMKEFRSNPNQHLLE